MRKEGGYKMEKKQAWLFPVLFFILFFLVAVGLCGCGGGGGSNPLPVQKTLESIAVQPADNKLAVGKTQQFGLYNNYSDGTQTQILSPLTWESVDKNIASIDSTGMVTAVGPGVTDIIATLDNVKYKATLTVPDPAPKLVSIAITPSSPTIAINTSQQFTASGAYSDGTFKNLTSGVTWSSSDMSKATIDANGKATALAGGSTKITATLSGISGTATLTVSPVSVTLVSITVTPSSSTVAVGTTQQFVAKGSFSDSTTQDLTSSVIWSSSAATSIVTIDQTGKASAVGAGSTTITATSGGKSGTATLTVSPVSVTLVSIAVTPSSQTIAAGSSQQFTATGTFSDNTTQDLTTQVSWSSSVDAIATIGQDDGKAYGTAVGTTVITASLGTISGAQSLNVIQAATTATGIWEGTYTIYDAVNKADIGTYTFKLVLNQNENGVTGTSALRYSTEGQLEADGQFTEAIVTGNKINFKFTYKDPKTSHMMVDIGTATIIDTSMTGDVIENYNGGYNCSYIFKLEKQ
ncbi:MAG: Ig-like domain-containing protein [Desulfuromonadaceae bacterium]|nr:Ig-like domain-containing protein [Desulfuromonadaceae bacterium]